MVHLRDLTLAAALLLGIANPAYGLYTKSGPVLLVDSSSFAEEILQSEHAAVVEFFAPWCGHCKNLAPHYEKAAKSLKGLAKVAAVDCDAEKNKALCSSQGVQGFPTLKLFRPSNKKGNPVIEDYNGARTAKAIVEAVVDRIPNHVQRVTSATLGDFLSKKNESAKAILFTLKGTTSALYKALAIDFLGSMKFAQVRDKEEEAVELFGIEKFPTLVVLPGGEAPGKVYEGELKKAPIFEFLSTIAPPSKAKREEGGNGTEKKKPKQKKAKKEKKEKKEEKKQEEPPVEDEETKTESKIPQETPKVPLMIPDLTDETSLVDACFARKSKTCVIALVSPPKSDPQLDPALKGLNVANEEVAHTTKLFFFYKVSLESEHGKALAEALDLGSDHPTIVAVNGHKRWYRPFTGEPSADGILDWLDAIKLGDLKKLKLPKGLFEPADEEGEKKKPEAPPAEEEPKEKPKEEEVPPVESPVEVPVKEEKPAADRHDEL